MIQNLKKKIGIRSNRIFYPRVISLNIAHDLISRAEGQTELY